MLYLVPTPIGNLEDITLRALRVLKEVALIACEDTRHTRKLLNHYNLDTPTISYHEHNEHDRVALILERLQQNQSVAIVSDAGMPGISDPGAVIVRAAVTAGFPVTALPGPCAFVAALAASGMNTESFYFAGFLPAKKQARHNALQQLAQIEATLVFYEAPHRIHECLRDALEVLGNRQATVARELSKHFEQYLRLPLKELMHHFETHEPRGEFVLLIAGYNPVEPAPATQTESETLLARIETLMQERGISANAAIKLVSQERGISKREVYNQWIKK
ncbi:MAG: 16S rRNA (cytidine(1402)-2'-O)-methyltransferase [Blastocatellia bacterium]|nr:16S rRNA (cytidine(1402)-2'-O)-methyltransferase [Blastocatellia bacterium]